MAFWNRKSKKSAESPKAAPKVTSESPKQTVPPAPEENTLSQVQNIIAVAAGKGGVGKSTVSVNLAYALKEQGYKVGILDTDLYGPSVPIMVQVDFPTEMRGHLIVPPQKDGIKIISPSMFSAQKANIMRGPMAANFIRQLLKQSDWGALDYLILDYPPGTGDIQLTLSQSCNITAALVVCTPQEVAIADAQKAAQMFGTLKVPILGILETMSWFVCDGCEKKHFIFKEKGGIRLAQELGVPLLGQIPLDPKLTECGDAGTPFLKENSQSAAGQAFQTAASSFTEEVKNVRNFQKLGLSSFTLKWQKEAS